MFGRSNKDKGGASSNRWLVIGLGNPGKEYEKTRHNVGAALIAEYAKKAGVKFSSHKSRADIAEISIGVGAQRVSLIAATLRCYMNESGGPTSSLANFFKVSNNQIVIAHDELDIPFQSIRIKYGGGDNGHNGLKSVTSGLSSSDYYRIRLGIGRPVGEQDPADFVLKPFSSAERKDLDQFLQKGIDALELLITQGLERAQNSFNK
ncbi:MAG: aminoacyl-tRNA hydrolase [Actinobacteria bacterium]|nr:aminoacyl-tRNA hydrolase [Actinomycetota bacterium]NBO07054.1 aminoacyl-tRNA hydrolase [Actinomycetota bacterium]NBO47114.1 aminoacyl-tRNA hydrolase [Actinomycetota bacterium]NBP12034.1 aminoacyl-tRNA hydrolase [Actinomycetota bacterium]NBP21949.1 aminoacyl-tRNA hydrolase [Actinomycetota bacterium]